MGFLQKKIGADSGNSFSCEWGGDASKLNWDSGYGGCFSIYHYVFACFFVGEFVGEFIETICSGAEVGDEYCSA